MTKQIKSLVKQLFPFRGKLVLLIVLVAFVAGFAGAYTLQTQFLKEPQSTRLPIILVTSILSGLLCNFALLVSFWILILAWIIHTQVIERLFSEWQLAFIFIFSVGFICGFILHFDFFRNSFSDNARLSLLALLGASIFSGLLLYAIIVVIIFLIVVFAPSTNSRND